MANQFTGLQLAFIDAYVGEAKFNTTEAARLAGYKGNGVTLAAVGYENLRKPQIAEEIKARLEARAMTSSELLMRWGEQARVDVALYYDEDNVFDLERFKKDGHGHLIKSIKPGRYGPVIEFVDKLKSQELIARNLAMLTDKVEQETTHKVDESNIDALRNRILGIKVKRGNQHDTERSD
jgi:phage terminase small subunit